jgi:hypothetical protein
LIILGFTVTIYIQQQNNIQQTKGNIMIVSKILVAVFGISVGFLGPIVDAPSASAPVVSDTIVTVNGAGGVLSTN